MNIFKSNHGWFWVAGLIISFISFCAISALAQCPSADLTGDCRVDLEDLAVLTSQWLEDGNEIEEKKITWVYIENDLGISGHEGFTGYISECEITNSQYCQFLNNALASGDIFVNNNIIYGANGSNDGVDFVDTIYYNLQGPGSTNDRVTNAGAARISYADNSFTVEAEFKNHPVTYVSWYGATAFCDYFGYRLPTEWQWQAVADYDGSYSYGCGTIINNNIANYLGTDNPDGTTTVSKFGNYGYGLSDLAGNVSEWTQSWYSQSQTNRVIKGGSWLYDDSNCDVTFRDNLNPDMVLSDVGFRICRSFPKPEITWVYINDPGVEEHEAFDGYMSKYETTNKQFCQFLNSALASGDIYVSENIVYGAKGLNSGADFENELYYNLAGEGSNKDGITNGGAARINYAQDSFTVDTGYEEHPVSYVSWYGATAFCNYYNWKLPTEWQWQAVADYDGSYAYGCGADINNTKANYTGSVHPDGTTAVGSFGTYGYGMCDMAGNVLEWTSSYYLSESFHISRGGSWEKDVSNCTVSYMFTSTAPFSYSGLGFRVCH